MYLLNIRPIGSGKVVLDEETMASVGTDKMYLVGRGKGMKKADEGGREEMMHQENNGGFVEDVSGQDHPVESSGGNGHGRVA